jgi:threonine/homoserine/homoserine lactone efflux protein
LFLQLMGGIFLIYLGVKTWRAKPAEKTTYASHKTLSKDFISTFFLTITNPMTILSYLAVFAGLGLTHSSGNYAGASWLVLGVFMGSALWWLILSEGVTLFRKKVSQKVMTWINRFAGLLIMSFGAVACLTC